MQLTSYDETDFMIVIVESFEVEKMTIHEFGKENEETLVLLHPLGVRWDIFNSIVPILKKDYHIVIPAIPGFDPDMPEADFTSVEQIADEIADWFIDKGLSGVKCLYGCSMGGAVVTRILAVGKIEAAFAVIDGGITPYQLWKPLTYLIGIRDFIMLELGKHISLKALRSVFDAEKYTEDDIRYVKEVFDGLNAKTIWRSFYSCNNYSMPEPVPPVNCKIAYWYGSNEKKARKWDIAYISKIFPNVKIVENAGMDHAEFFILHPKEFCEKLVVWMSLMS